MKFLKLKGYGNNHSHLIPLKSITDIEFETNYTGSLKAEILNIVGQVVYSEEINHSTGLNTWQMNQNSLSKGVYLFNIFFEGKNYTSRMIIE